MNKFTLRLADGRWVSSPTNIVTDNPNLAGVFTATDNQSAAELRGAMERLHGPLEIVPWQSKRSDALTRQVENMTLLDEAQDPFAGAEVLYAYTRCLRSTFIVVACSLIAVAWQLGLLRLLGYALDPYSVLVPFLVFAIGMSHGAQKMNGILQDVGRGTHRVVAARYTFRRLFVAGLTALLCDAVGFAVLALIDIRVIQDLAANASIGVAVLIFTNLVLLPVLLSYVGVSPAAARRSLKQEQSEQLRGAWAWFASFTTRASSTIQRASSAASVSPAASASRSRAAPER